MNLPNFLSFVRIFSVPLFIWMVLNHQIYWGLFLFIMAGITDALDGYIANKFDKVTELGTFLDPLADKILLTSAFVTLNVTSLIPLWITLMVVTRDLVIIAGAMVFQVLTGTLKMEPLPISKVNTVMQIILISVVMGSEIFPIWPGIKNIMFAIVVLTTLSSGFIYIYIWTKKAVEKEGS
ncbi:MAG: CDP-alcohol phosphatidyltransferase family protein [Magnetococcales bacterium]|nr:CDP-alcohol phosphatidyltransferase family protein [Magnetococcales bacterium]MBF0150625.1 CDP-alcohol phosphatidyltransferase family protein [Magnetococcales bacterium]MBF0174551.1 CDP-alcohol phosphatidyltransferase family protein [Magnetococcales bacterium]MBF0348554.1 CDP-alcohol phosphatidyltransferase family protein [Magnetococcales bacterium]MBF0629359.1 CDP-alcohol phosphatidyltransferase family protein [Magnetococcales bacterium]